MKSVLGSVTIVTGMMHCRVFFQRALQILQLRGTAWRRNKKRGDEDLSASQHRCIVLRLQLWLPAVGTIKQLLLADTHTPMPTLVPLSPSGTAM